MNKARSKRQNSSTRHAWPVPMKVKPSHIEGRGLFTTVHLRARQKIGEFTGERISQREGRRRAKTQKWIVILELNHKQAIDAAKEPSGFRFMNHSCSPNTFMRIIGERAEFYALHGMRAGTELTVDCHPSHHNGTLPCKCGSATCRGML
jgi:SET domain-containing protein